MAIEIAITSIGVQRVALNMPPLLLSTDGCGDARNRSRVVHEDWRVAGEHIVRVDRLRRSRRRHDVDHDPELGIDQIRHAYLIDGSRH